MRVKRDVDGSDGVPRKIYFCVRVCFLLRLGNVFLCFSPLRVDFKGKAEKGLCSKNLLNHGTYLSGPKIRRLDV